jgi:hypothetical protein
MKKRDWTIRRDSVASLDAQRRWDQAYQWLVHWSMTASSQQTGGERVGTSRQEENYEDRYVCTGFDPTTSTKPNH